MADESRTETGKEVPDSVSEPQAGAPDQETPEQRAHWEARRRVLTGGLAGAPFIVTLSSRPALATYCSVSAMGSGNLSRVNEVTCQGNTPGYWKTHENWCSEFIIVGPCNPIYEDNGQCNDYSVPTKFQIEEELNKLDPNKQKDQLKILKLQDYLYKLEYHFPNTPYFGTPFAAVFGPGLTTIENLTLYQALWLEDTTPYGGPAPVLAHCVAAWLNAHRWGKEAFGFSPDEVVDYVNANLPLDAIACKDTLEALNTRSA